MKRKHALINKWKFIQPYLSENFRELNQAEWRQLTTEANGDKWGDINSVDHDRHQKMKFSLCWSREQL